MSGMRRPGAKLRFGEWANVTVGNISNHWERPKQFVKQPVVVSDDEEESNVGKMPSSDESDA